MSARDWLLLISLSILWGATFLFARIAIVEIPAMTLTLARVGIAAALLGLLLAARGGLPGGLRLWSAFLVMGLLNNALPFTLIFWAQAHLSAGLAAIFNATTPFFAVLVCHVLTRDEKATMPKLVGCAAGLAGVFVMLAPASSGANDIWPAAALAVLAGALSYAFAGLYGRRFARSGVDPMTAAFGQLAASTLVMAVLASIVDRPWTLAMPGAPVLFAVVAMAVLSTALAYILYFRILSTAGPTNLLLVTLLIPVSAALLGWLVLGESLAARHFAGMALIGVGLAAVDGRVFRLLVGRPA